LIKRVVSGLMLTLLITSTLTLMFNVQPVKSEWTGTVYIRADGSIDPPDAPIITYDDVTYILIDDIVSYHYGIIIERDNIILDGAGYAVKAPIITYPFNGIDLNNRYNITIRNTQVIGFWYGVELVNSSNNTISGNNIKNIYGGVNLRDSSNNTISGNNIKNIYGGVNLRDSSNNTISGNNIKNNRYGVTLQVSSNNTINGNVFFHDGLFVIDSYGNLVVDNVVNGEPLVYLEGVSDVIVNDAGQVILVNCNHITVENLNISDVIVGINLQDTNDSIISGNNITNNVYGVNLRDSSNNTISGNNIKNNENGVLLGYSSNNSVSGNNLIENSDGVSLYESSNNSIAGNNITSNTLGVFLHTSSNNIFYHNNFINNDFRHAIIDPTGYANIWDDGYPSGGNYWSDYMGVDVKWGPGQDLHGSDGIGDTPYVIDADNRDCYPLMYPYGASPPPMYSLTITTTVGGTTDPVPGTYTYTAYSSVQVTAIPNVDYVFDHWELDTVNVDSANPYTVLMDNNHTLKAGFVYSPPPPLIASISPASAPIIVNRSVTLISTVSGGYTPYSYQWYLNGTAVSGAVSPTWTFTPAIIGTYTVYLMVTDRLGNTVKSNEATVTVAPHLTVSISPMSASVLVGQSVSFTSTVSGGYAPYSYQWYLKGSAVSGATLNTWAFTPTTSGIFYVHLKVTDAKGNTAQSEAARITVAIVPVGGYSIPIQPPTTTKPVTIIASLTILTALFVTMKQKTRRKYRQ